MDSLEAAVLISLLPPSNEFSLIYEIPAQCRAVLDLLNLEIDTRMALVQFIDELVEFVTASEQHDNAIADAFEVATLIVMDKRLKDDLICNLQAWGQILMVCSESCKSTKLRLSILYFIASIENLMPSDESLNILDSCIAWFQSLSTSEVRSLSFGEIRRLADRFGSQKNLLMEACVVSFLKSSILEKKLEGIDYLLTTSDIKINLYQSAISAIFKEHGQVHHELATRGLQLASAPCFIEHLHLNEIVMIYRSCGHQIKGLLQNVQTTETLTGLIEALLPELSFSTEAHSVISYILSLKDAWPETLILQIMHCWEAAVLKGSKLVSRNGPVIELGTSLVVYSTSEWFATLYLQYPRATEETWFLEWIVSLCEHRHLSLETCTALFANLHFASFKSVAAFRCLRILFCITNQSKMELVMEQSTDQSLAKFEFYFPTCEPSNLDSIGVFWDIVTSEETTSEVFDIVSETLEFIYHRHLEPDHPSATRVRKEFVSKIASMLHKNAQAHISNIVTSRCLSFLQALLDEADREGTRGFRPHASRLRGKIHSVTVFGNVTIALYGNATVYDLRCAIGARMTPPMPPARVGLIWNGQSFTAKENSKTLSYLNFGQQETVDSFVIDIKDDEQRVRLLDNTGKLTPAATKAFTIVFRQYSNTADSLDTTRVMTQEGFEGLFVKCTGATNQKAIRRRVKEIFAKYSSKEDESYLSLENFFKFYQDSVSKRLDSVWKDLHTLGFNNLLHHQKAASTRLTTEFRSTSIQQTPSLESDEPEPVHSWRPILAEEEVIYDSLFCITATQTDPSKQSSEQTMLRLRAWDLLMRLPTASRFSSVFSKCIPEDLDRLMNPGLIYQGLYVCHILLPLLEAGEDSSMASHVQRARRASFEAPKVAVKGTWRSTFESVKGFERLLQLVVQEPEHVSSCEEDIVVQMKELVCKAYVGSLSEMDIVSHGQRPLYEFCIRELNRYQKQLPDGEVTLAERILSIWDTFRVDLIKGTWQSLPLVNVFTNWQSGGERVTAFQNNLLRSLVYTCGECPALFEEYIKYLNTNMEKIGACEWATLFYEELLAFDTDVEHLDYAQLYSCISKEVLRGNVMVLRLLRVMVELNLPIVSNTGSEKSMKSLITMSIRSLLNSHRLKDSAIVQEFLASTYIARPEFRFLITSSYILPVLRSLNTSSAEYDSSNVMGDEQKTCAYVGLRNLGNTCYVNSIVQQLARIPSVAQGIMDCSDLSSIAEVITYLRQSTRKWLVPYKIIESFQINVYEQHDAEEFMNQVLDRLDSKLFESSIKVTRMCRACQKSTSFDEECGSHIAVDFSGYRNIQDAFSSPKHLSGLTCDHCGFLGQIYQSQEWKQKPIHGMIFHLKRFNYSWETSGGKKLKVSDPFHFEESVFDYTLTGVVSHRGDTDSGHYYSYIKDDAGQWFELNDTICRPLQGFPTEAYESGYILFYTNTKSKEKPVVVPEVFQRRVVEDNEILFQHLTLELESFQNLVRKLLDYLTISSQASNQKLGWADLGRENDNDQATTTKICGMIFKYVSYKFDTLTETTINKMFDKIMELLANGQHGEGILAAICQQPIKSRHQIETMERLFDQLSETQFQPTNAAWARGFILNCTEIVLNTSVDMKLCRNIIESITSLVCLLLTARLEDEDLNDAEDWFSAFLEAVLPHLESLKRPVSLLFVQSISSLSETAASNVAYILSHHAFSTKSPNLISVLRDFLDVEDIYMESRLNSVIDAALSTSLEFLSKVLRVLSTDDYGPVKITVLSSRSHIIFIATNPSTVEAKVEMWFTETSKFVVPEYFTCVINQRSRNIINRIKKLNMSQDACCEYRCLVNGQGMQAEVEPLQTIDPENVSRLANTPTRTKVEAIQAMGFKNTRQIQQALRAARGDETRAIEYLVQASPSFDIS